MDDLIIQDSIGLHLIYVQTVSDIENGWILVPKESLKNLTSLQSQANKRDVSESIQKISKSKKLRFHNSFVSFQYVRVAQRLKYYGYMKFPNCTSDYPQPNTANVIVYIGNRELIFITNRREEIVFKVTRMKCWRITLHHVRKNIVLTYISLLLFFLILCHVPFFCSGQLGSSQGRILI